ncbi:ribose ABC transporter permease [Clostridium sediminicola]|uniref:ABC transporter permease n=1 Tax=Clostridium sediminicola TaxID=3114879 RepID=UPI0031F1E258
MELLKSKNSKSKKASVNFVEYTNIISIIVLLIIFTSINQNFLSSFNIKNLLEDLAPLLVLGCGVTCVLLICSIDLSVGSIVSCSTVLFVILLPKLGYGVYFVVALYGIMAGLINGVVYTKVKIPSFIVTLGFSSVWQSAAYLISGGAPLQIPFQQGNYIAWGKMDFGVITSYFIIGIVVLAIFYVIQTRTYFGKGFFAVGANERAAKISGINVDFVKISAFALCGLTCALTGIFLSAKLKSGIPTVGDPFTLKAIAAVALGGTSLGGGKGSVMNTLLGVAIVTVIHNGMNVVGVNAFWQHIVFGALVIAAVAMTVDRKERGSIVK